MTDQQNQLYTAHLVWRIGARELDFSGRPGVMGILNVTPDSFSDGGSFDSVDRAVARALEMEDEGADIIDIGGESTRPGAEPVGETEELARIVPVIERLKGRLGIPISIDTYKASVARAALDAGAEIVNDISAMTFDKGMIRIVAVSKAGIVLMHSRGTPLDMQRNTTYNSVIDEVSEMLRNAAERAVAGGIEPGRIVVDPGIGFGKDREGNCEIISRMGEFVRLGFPVLAGPSRKSFIGQTLGREVEDRLFGTAAAVAASVLHGAAIVRVHDVRQMRDVADMAWAVRSRTTAV